MYNMCRFAFGIDHETNVYGCVGFTTRCKVLEDPTVTTLLKKLCVDSFDLRPTRGYLRESRSYHRFSAPESGARAAIFATWFDNGKWFAPDDGVCRGAPRPIMEFNSEVKQLASQFNPEVEVTTHGY